MLLSQTTLTELADHMERLGVPGLSMAIFERDGNLRSYVIGVSDATRGDEVTERTLFQAASVSKAVTSVGALRLVEEGELELDGEVNSRLVRWKIPTNRFTRQRAVTLRHILTHTAGFTVSGFRGYAQDEKIPGLLQILDGRPPANNEPIRVTGEPGRAYRYSGGGFTVLQALLEDVTGKRFGPLMDHLVLRPAGMRSSRFEQPLGSRASRLAAVGHDAHGKPIEGGWHAHPELAAAGLWTTAEDLARLGLEISREVEGKSERLLSPRMAREMVRRQKGRMGLGWGISRRGRYRTVEHDGWNLGYRSQLCIGAGGPVVAVMTNSDRGNEVALQVLGSVLGGNGSTKPRVRRGARPMKAPL